MNRILRELCFHWWAALAVCMTLSIEMPVFAQPTLDDIKGRLGNRNSVYVEADLIGYAHEGTHGVNSIIRERKPGSNAAYIGGGKFGQFQEPKLTLSDVRLFVPIDFQGVFYRYLHSGTSWEHNPLYILDEWSAYLNGSRVGREINDSQIAGRTKGSDEGLCACCVFGQALLEAVDHCDPNYAERAELTAFVGEMTQASAEVLGDIPPQAIAKKGISPKARRLSVVGGGRYTARGYETENFAVAAPTRNIAQQIGDTAEMWRYKHAVEWFGEEMPAWSQKCPITAQCAPGLGSGGRTDFVFQGGEVGGWNMRVQGTQSRLLDSVVPHEVLHTVFAAYTRQPIPRWADEGACSTIEHESEVRKYDLMLYGFLKQGRGIPFSVMFATTDYPTDVMPLYAQGTSVSKWLIDKHGRDKFIAFVTDTIGVSDIGQLSRIAKEHFGYESTLAMQNEWNDWVRQGSPLQYQCGYGPCDGGCCDTCVYDDGWRGAGNAVVITKPTRPAQPAPPAQPAINVAQLKADILAELTVKINAAKCKCDHSGDVTMEQVNAAIAAYIEAHPPAPYTPPTPQEQAEQLAPYLSHSATITLLDGTKKTQTKPLNVPLDFTQRSVVKK